MSERARWIISVLFMIVILACRVSADYTNGLVARWTFKFADKTLDDVGVNSAVTVGNGVTFVNGYAVFNGDATAKLNAGIGAGGELDITPALTIWMRVNLNAGTNWQGLAQRWGTAVTNQSYTWYVRPPSLCTLQMVQKDRQYTNATDYVQTVGSALPAYNYTNYYNDFHNVALVFNPTKAVNFGAWEFYIDGTRIAWQTSYKLTNSVGGGYWNVGTWTSTEPLIFGSLLGVVDEIRVYNQSLDSTSLNQIVPYVIPCGALFSFH